MGLESEVLHGLADPTVPFLDDANHSFEIVIISETADRVIGGGWRWPLASWARRPI